jgi:hypothetical protein
VGDEQVSLDPVIVEMQKAALGPDTMIKLTWAFNLSKGGETQHGVQLYKGKRKIGMMLCTPEGVESTPANALRALADLLEITE